MNKVKKNKPKKNIAKNNKSKKNKAKKYKTLKTMDNPIDIQLIMRYSDFYEMYKSE